MGQLQRLRPPLRAATAIALDMAHSSGEPERGSLVAPIERQARIGISLLAVSSGGCLPARIAATMSGARNFSRTIRDA